MSKASSKAGQNPAKTVGEKPGTDQEKLKALQTAFQTIERNFGKNAIWRLGEQPTRMNVDVIPTGCLSLDLALGVGGLPKGRIVEIFGPEAGGKTTIALHAVAQAQAEGGIVAFVDAEHALDPSYARRLGVDVDNLLVSQPDSGEQALEITEQLVRSGAVDIVVVDSVAALVPRAELEGDMGDAHMGLQARLMSQALRKLTPVVGRYGAIVIFINQIREKIGVLYGSPETTTGGRALKFYASVRLDVRRIDSIRQGGEVLGVRTRAKVVKNKVAPPFRSAEFDILYGHGISRMGDVLDVAIQTGIVERAGSWFSFDGERLGQGRERVLQEITANPDVAKKIEVQVRQSLAAKASEKAAAENDTNETTGEEG